MTIQWKKSICPYCGVGCGLNVGVEDGKVVDIHGLKGYPVNDGDICHLAANLPAVFTAEERLTGPMIRRDGELVPSGWDETIEHTASNLKRIIDKHGPDSVAFYGGAINLSEEYYLINKLMKAAIGTNNVECSTRLCMSSSALGFISTIGIDAPPACYADIEEADLFFIAGSNMAVSLPVLFNRVHTTNLRNNDTKVIVVDPRRTETAEIADIHLQIWPGTDVAINNAIANILLKEGYVDEEHVNTYCSGFNELKKHLEKYTPSKAAGITGCQKEKIIEAAHTIGRAKAMLAFWMMGYNHSTQALFKNNTLHNLLLLTGNYCRPGAGMIGVNGEANTQGNRWVGTLSHLLPGIRMISDPKHRQELADFWNIPVDKISTAPGRSIIDIIKGLHSGEVRALWISTTNPAVSLPNSNWIEEGLNKAEFLIVQDIFHPTATTMLADVVLAGAHWCEKTGTYISSERRVELVEKMVEPPGKAKADYEIIWSVARAMGFDKEFPYTTPEEVFEEFKKITHGRICDMGGVSYKRLRGGTGPQLPCPEAGHPGTARLFQDMSFPRPGGRAALLARDYIGAAERIDPEYPIVLITGRQAEHFNTRTRSGCAKSFDDSESENFIEIHTDDAESMEIGEGDELEVISRRGRVNGPARITDRVLPRTIYMNMHYSKIPGVGSGKQANLVTNAVYDVHTSQPEFKYCAVAISKVSSEYKKDHYLSKPPIDGDVDAMNKAANFLEGLICTCPAGILITDSAQNIIMANQTLCNIFDCSNNEVIETNLFIWLEQFGPDAIRVWTELENNIYQKGCCHNVELQKRTASDVKRCFSVNASRSKQMIIDDTRCIISIWNDITKLKNAEEGQLKSQQMLNLVMDNIPQSIFWKDKNSVYLGCNRNFAKGAGIARTEDIVGKTDYDLAWKKEEADFYRKCDKRVMKTGQPEYHIVQPQLQANGKQAWLDTNKIPLCDLEGKTIGILGTYEDITERKLSEENMKGFADVIEESLNEIYIFDAKTLRFILVNRGARQNLGYSLEELLNLTPLDLTPKLTAESYAKLIEPLQDGGKQKIVFTTVQRRKDGSLYDVDVHLQLTTFQSIPAFVAIILDITEYKQITAILEEARNKAEVASITKSEFLANVSHELKTPLNAVIGFSEVLMDKSFGEVNVKQEKYLNNINSGGKRLLEMIDRIIDLSNVETGKMELELDEVLLPQLLKYTVTSFQPSALKKNITIKTHIDNELLPVAADQAKLKRIVSLFIDNSIKFTPDGGMIRVEAIGLEGGVQISVTDTGIGIKPEEQKHIFDGFTQVDSTITRKHGGLGLGLALARRLTILHGGKIWMKSPPGKDMALDVGKGSSFIFTIPYKPEQHDGQIVDPMAKFLLWECFIEHVERILLLHERMKHKFCLLHLEPETGEKELDPLTFAEVFKDVIRKYEIFTQSKDRKCYCTVLFEVDRGKMEKAVERIDKALKARGFSFNITTVIYPEDGDSVEALCKALKI